jgi:phosphoenolpyruvate synthase/pyruvate phosphate dikinase
MSTSSKGCKNYNKFEPKNYSGMSKLSTLQELHLLKIHVPQTFKISNIEDFSEFSRSGMKSPIIMRSSFAMEDGMNFAFAGMFNSYFPITTLDEYILAIQECTKIPDRARIYAKNIGYTEVIGTPEIFLQEFIVGDFSGVVFTEYNGDNIRIECVPGILAPLLQGEVGFPLVIEAPRNCLDKYEIKCPYLSEYYTTLD